MILPSLKKDHHVVILFAFFALLYGVLLIYFENPISDELLIFLIFPILISTFHRQSRIYIPLTIITGIVSSVVLYFVASHPLSSTVTAIVILTAVSVSSELIFLTLKKNREILQSLQDERNLLEKINETIPIGVVVVKHDGQISFANQKAEEIFGLTIDDLSLRSYNSSQWQITDIDGNPFPEENLPFQKVIQSKEPVYDIQHSINSPNGKVIHLSINGAPLFNEQNQLDRVVFSVEDITEQIQKEKELIQSEKSNRNILESSPMGIHLYRLDENDNLIFNGANPAADQILGIEHQSLFGETIESAFPFHQHTSIPEHYKQICRYGNAWHSDYLSYKDDQIEGIFEIHAFQTAPNHMAVFFMDVTEKKKAEKALQDSENRFRTIFNNVHDAIFIHELDGTILQVNDAMAKLYGISKDEAIKYSIAEDYSSPENDLSQLNTYWENVCKGEPQYLNWKARRPLDGSLFDVEVFLNRVMFNSKSVILACVRDVTLRKKAEEKLLKESQFRKTIIDNAAEGICVCHDISTFPYLYFTVWNNRLLEITGYTREEINKEGCLELLVPQKEKLQKAKERMQELDEGVQLESEEWIISHKDGSERIISISSSFLYTESSGTHTLLMVRDITEREKLNKALKESEKRFKHLIEHSPVAIGIADMEGNITYINREFVHTIGYTLDEIPTLDDWWDKAYPEPSYREIVKQSWESDIRKAQEEHVDFKGKIFTIHCKDGVERTFDISGTRIDDQFIVIFNDITDRIKIENELREREMTIQSIFRAAPIGIGYVRDRILGWTNEFFHQLIGYTKDELSNQSTRILYPSEEEFLRVGQIVYKTPPTSRTTFAESKFKHKNGHLITVVISITPLDFEDISAGHIFTVQDLTNLRKAEEVRNRLFNLSVDMFCIAEPDGYFKELNPAWYKTLGWSKDELLSKQWIEFVHPDDVEETIRISHQLIHEGKTIINFENRYRCKDGSWRWLSWNSTHDKNEELIFAVARDVTEQKKLEAQLIHSQKMEAVGQLAGGIAHDFNNLLTAILGYSDLIMIRLSQHDPLLNEMGEIKKSAERAMGLTRQLLAFSRKQIMQPIPLDLNELIVNIDKMLRRIIGEDIEFIIIPGENLSLVKADPGQLEQVIINLAVNARDAMPQGGKLIVATQNITVGSDHSKQQYGIQLGHYVMVSITDTGLGIKPAIVDKIFEPFFTTKEKGKGTGLGLSTVHGIVRQSGGHITVESELNQGTTFKIYLPKTETGEPQKPQSQESVLNDIPQGTEMILLVEDEELVRNLVETVLTAQGYSVISASYGEEALQILSDLHDHIDLLITDVVLPQMSGKELALEILKARPATKVLYISGYTDDAIVHHGVLEEGIYFLQKPFLPNILLEKVYEILSTEGT